jgi:hypothetical protein
MVPVPSWLRRLPAAVPAPRKSVKQPRRFRPTLELLEGRECPATVQFFDGTFNNSDWLATEVVDTVTGGGTFTASQVATGGNPGSYRAFSFSGNAPGDYMVGHLRIGATYNPSQQGAIAQINYSFDLNYFDAGPGKVAPYALLLVQNGTHYESSFNSAESNMWTTVQQTGLTSANFTRRAGPGPFNPDFSASGSVIQFGYYFGVMLTAGTFVNEDSGLDNWSVTVDTVEPPIYVTGSDAGGTARVNVYHAHTGRLLHSFNPFTDVTGNFQGGVRVAVADINNDGVTDVYVASGKGMPGGSRVRVFDGVDIRAGVVTRLIGIFPFGTVYTGPVFVTGGDINGDGFAEIMYSRTGTGPNVRVVDGFNLVVNNTFVTIRDFMPFGAAYKGGVTMAVGDVNGDGTRDLITGQSRDGSLVRVFSGADLSVRLSSFRAGPVRAGGIFVAAGVTDFDNRADIIVGSGAGGTAQVRIYAGSGITATSATLSMVWTAYDTYFTGGVRVAAINIHTAGTLTEVLVATGQQGGCLVRVFDPFLFVTEEVERSFVAYDRLFHGGGVFVA